MTFRVPYAGHVSGYFNDFNVILIRGMHVYMYYEGIIQSDLYEIKDLYYFANTTNSGNGYLIWIVM